ncbi:unnamed protein product [Boreogadus saida]
MRTEETGGQRRQEDRGDRRTEERRQEDRGEETQEDGRIGDTEGQMRGDRRTEDRRQEDIEEETQEFMGGYMTNPQMINDPDSRSPPRLRTGLKLAALVRSLIPPFQRSIHSFRISGVNAVWWSGPVGLGGEERLGCSDRKNENAEESFPFLAT